MPSLQQRSYKKMLYFYFFMQYFTKTGIYSMYVHLNFEN